MIRQITSMQKRKSRLPKLVSCHVMMAFIRFCPNLDQWVKDRKAEGINHFWAYTDAYWGHYIADIKNFLDVAYANGVPVMVGAQNGTSVGEWVALIRDTWEHPGLHKINGKKVYESYDHFEHVMQSIYDALLIPDPNATGYKGAISKEDVYLLGNTRYPMWVYWENPPYWIEYYSSVSNIGQVDHVYDSRPLLSGLVNFAVDHGNDTNHINMIANENDWIAQVGKTRGKYSMAGGSAFYASVQFTNAGFVGLKHWYEAIIAKEPSQRPDAFSFATSNDYVELSYVAPVTSVVDGVFHLPSVNSGFFIGSNCREVLTDHSGAVWFVKPYIDAFKSDAVSINITEDKMFGWYWLHPKDAPTIPNIPDEVAAQGPKYTQEWWADQVWAKGSITVAGQNQVYGIKNELAHEIDKIEMGAHLTAPGYLRIKIAGQTYVSSLKQKGVATWECPQAIGTPEFSILNLDMTERKKGVGVRAITNSLYPGGHNPLITKIVSTI